MTDLVDYSDRIGQRFEPATTRTGVGKAIATAAGAAVSIYFVIVAFCIYWLAILPAAAVSWIIPSRLLERFALPLLVMSATGAAILTQTIDGFFPDYSNPREILAELALWCGVGVFARCYLAYTKQPATFDEVKASIETRWPDRWFAANLHNPLDAAFTRIFI
jgi:hypothetical protein